MDFLQIVVLSIVQGIAEFLPISSSGHVVVVAALFEAATKKPLADVLEVNIVLHFGTLLAIVIFYWHRLWRLLGEDRRTIGLLVVGSVPIAVVGLAVKKFAPGILESAFFSGWMLLFTAGVLFWARRHLDGQESYEQLGYGKALWIGLWQAMAVLPGVSRSGTTIAAGLSVGLRAEAAAAFSFLLAVPAIFGANLLELRELIGRSEDQTPLGLLAMGAALACVVGLLSLKWLLAWLQRGKLHYFAIWCLTVGFLVIIWQLSIRSTSPGEEPNNTPAAVVVPVSAASQAP